MQAKNPFVSGMRSLSKEVSVGFSGHTRSKQVAGFKICTHNKSVCVCVFSVGFFPWEPFLSSFGADLFYSHTLF